MMGNSHQKTVADQEADPDPIMDTDNVHDYLNDTRWSRMMHHIFPTGFKAEARTYLRLLPPLVISNMCQFYVQPIAIIFAGHLGKIELDAVGLSCSLINVLGYCIALGMSSACEATFAQTFGGNNKKMMGVHLQKCVFIFALSSFPCYALHLNIEGLLQLIGQDHRVARLVGRYLLIHTPGTFCMFIYLALLKYFQSQNIVYPDIWMGLLAHIIHAALQYLLLFKLDLGVDGSAIALAFYYTFSLLVRIIYFLYSKEVKVTWGGWTLQCFVGWGTLIRLALIGAVLVVAEWGAYEAGIILSGLLGTAELGAQTSIFNMNILANAVSWGFSLALTIIMGQQLGAGLHAEAKTSSRVAMVFVSILGAIFLIVIMAFRYQISTFFTNEQDVQNIIVSVMPLVGFFLSINTITTLGRVIYRALAKQTEAAIIAFLCYYVVAIPLGFGLMFYTPLHIYGLWIGFLTCTCLLTLFMTTRFLWFFDWEALSIEAQKYACVRGQDGNKPLLANNPSQGQYGTVKEPSVKLPRGHSFSQSESEPIKVEAYALDEQDEQYMVVTRRQIIEKIIIIILFVGIIIVGILIRLATSEIVASNRVSHNTTIAALPTFLNVTLAGV